MINERIEVLDQCIGAIRSGRRSLQECIAANPEHEDELGHLLPLVLSIQPPAVSPDPFRKLQARHAFIEAIHAEREQQSRRWWSSLPFARGVRPFRLAAFTINALAVLIFATSAVAGAKEAQPGDLLYGLKTTIEQVQIVTAITPDNKATVRLYIAGERLAEIQRALASGKRDVADNAASAYLATMNDARRDIEVVRATGLPTGTIQQGLQDNLDRQEAVIAQASQKGATTTEQVVREVQLVPSESRVLSSSEGASSAIAAAGQPAAVSPDSSAAASAVGAPLTGALGFTVIDDSQNVADTAAGHPPLAIRGSGDGASTLVAPASGGGGAARLNVAGGSATPTPGAADETPVGLPTQFAFVSGIPEGQITAPTLTPTARPTWTVTTSTPTSTAMPSATRTLTNTPGPSATPTTAAIHHGGFSLDGSGEERDRTPTATAAPHQTPAGTAVSTSTPAATPTSSAGKPTVGPQDHVGG